MLRSLASRAPLLLLLAGCLGDPPAEVAESHPGSQGGAGQGGGAGAMAGASGGSGQSGSSGYAGASGDGKGGSGASGKGGAGQAGAGQAGAGQAGADHGGSAGQGGGGGQAGGGAAGAGQGGAGGGQAGAGAGGAEQGGSSGAGSGLAGSDAGAGEAGQGGGGEAGAAGAGAGQGGAGQAGSGGVGCGSQAECDGVCADTQRDEKNCGSCGKSCNQGEVCVEGACDTALDLVAGDIHGCARFSSGKVRCWGGAYGVGYGEDVNVGVKVPPGKAVALSDKASSIAAGASSSCAVVNSGAVYCWGLNTQGQLGVNGTKSTYKPTVAVGLGTTAQQASIHLNNGCALLVEGGVRCWGLGATGRLGNPAIKPIGEVFGDDESLSGASSNVAFGQDIKAKQISTSLTHSCAVLTTGKLRCWGFNNHGQLGYGHKNTIGDDEAPSQDVDLGSHFAKQVVAFGYSTCALLEDGTARCWGQNDSGQLGLGDTLDRGDKPETLPAALPAPSLGALPAGGIKLLAGGQDHVCALLTDGRVRCWGSEENGKLGNKSNSGSIGDEPTDVAADVLLDSEATQIAAGAQHTCALLKTGNVRCWGESEPGRLGYNPEDYGLGTAVGDDETPEHTPDVF